MNPLPKHLPITLPDGTEMPFRLIVDRGENAEFCMGARGFGANEEPVHRVVINQPYYLGVTPVTQQQYRAIAVKCEAQLKENKGNKGCSPSEFEGDKRPVESVDWVDATVICNWLTQSNQQLQTLNLAAGLPNEAQWEYACRAGKNGTEYANGDGEVSLDKVAHYSGNASETRDVGQKDANDFGLYDMHGNVREWCCDVFDPLAYSKRDDGWVAQKWTDADAGKGAFNRGSNDRRSVRVLRGGSWSSSAWGCRSACRFGFGAGNRVGSGGFRVCLVPRSGGQPNQDQPRKERVR